MLITEFQFCASLALVIVVSGALTSRVLDRLRAEVRRKLMMHIEPLVASVRSSNRKRDCSVDSKPCTTPTRGNYKGEPGSRIIGLHRKRPRFRTLSSNIGHVQSKDPGPGPCSRPFPSHAGGARTVIDGRFTQANEVLLISVPPVGLLRRGVLITFDRELFFG